MPTRYADADVFLDYRGVKVYYVYKNDDLDSGITRESAYSLDPDSRDECGEEYQGFNLTELPAYNDIAGPIGHATSKKVLMLAIDRGELNDLITEAIAEGGVEEHDVALKCGSCVTKTSDLNALLNVCPVCKRGTLEVYIHRAKPCPVCGVDLPDSGKCVTQDCNRVKMPEGIIPNLKATPFMY